MKFKLIVSITVVTIMLGFSFFFARELLKSEPLPVGVHLDKLILNRQNGSDDYILKKERPTVVLILSQTCEHCIYQIKSLKHNIDQYQYYDLLFLIKVTSEESDLLPLLSDLSMYENVTVQLVQEEKIQTLFGKGGVPRYYLLDQNGYLKRKLQGEVKSDYLLKEIESLFVRTQR